MTAVELTKVWKTRGGGWILEDVSLTVAKGEIVLVEGPSGSGKTTLLGVAAGLLTSDRGRVSLDGSALPIDGAVRRALRRRAVGFVFQRANLLSGLTVRENVLCQAALAGRGADEASREAAALLDALGIAHLAHRRPRELSGGEEQRAAVARALVHRPAVIMADEPTASLDAQAGAAVARVLADLCRQRGAAVLVATHDTRLRSIAPRRLRLEDGRLVEHVEREQDALLGSAM